jgi:single-strand DNA-binding protein
VPEGQKNVRPTKEKKIMSQDIITITGIVATTPRHLITSEELAITSFRFATTERRFDRSSDQWIDGDTNWFTVTAFRTLAHNVSKSVHKGDRLIVIGKLRIRDWATEDKAGTNVEIDAEALGHDLMWGTSTFSRNTTSVEPATGEGNATGLQAEAGDKTHA